MHELCDDLESLWFVILFEGLHFVKHNKPSGVDAGFIFDHVRVSLTTGTHTGGTGKHKLYTTDTRLMTRILEFDSKPFTVFFRQMYVRFKRLNAYYMAQDDEETPNDSVKENFRKLKNCAEIERLLREALDSGEWPESCDKAEDQYPPIRNLTPKQKDTIALSYVNRSLVPSEVSGVKRKREEEDDPQPLETKRAKTDLSLWKRIWSKFASLLRG